MARPLAVRVADLLRDPGSRRDLDVDVVLPGVATSVAAVADGTPIGVSVTVESLPGAALTITGSVSTAWTAECRRCLEPVTGTLDAAVKELAERDPIDDDVYEVDGDLLELEPMVRELVLAALPLAPLCRDDCPGPDPERFPAAAASDDEVAEDEPEVPVDPRWAPLADLDLDG